LPWSASTATAQIVAALTMQRSAIFRTIPVVPENVVISRVGSDLARAAAPSRAGSSLRTAVVLSGFSSPTWSRTMSARVAAGAHHDVSC